MIENKLFHWYWGALHTKCVTMRMMHCEVSATSKDFFFLLFCSADIIDWDLVAHYLEWLFNWLFIYCFTSHLRIFHTYGDVSFAGEGLQNLGLCSALRAFEQGGIFIVRHLLWHGASVFPVLSEWPPHSVASYDTHGDAEDLL